MLDGKKSTAERIVYDALAILSERTGKDPVEALETSIKALTRCSRSAPAVSAARPTRCPSRCRSAAPARLPCAGSWASPAPAASARWRNGSRTSSSTPSSSRAASYKRKDDIFRTAQANKAFAHYRW